MALARCDLCETPKGRPEPYVVAAEPIGYPESSTVCGTQGCENPALIWLKQSEVDAYHKGQRVFDFPTHAVKVRVRALYGEDEQV